VPVSISPSFEMEMGMEIGDADTAPVPTSPSSEREMGGGDAETEKRAWKSG